MFGIKNHIPYFLAGTPPESGKGFIPHVHTGETYKFGIKTKTGEYLEKLDPFGLYCETPPKTASIVWNTYKEWN
jgi:1,4-alpha-glucan branching enzyme